MSEHKPCEHCEEVRQEEEDKAFGEALRKCFEAPTGSWSRRIAEYYVDQLTAAPLPLRFDGPVTFKFWSDLDD